MIHAREKERPNQRGGGDENEQERQRAANDPRNLPRLESAANHEHAAPNQSRDAHTPPCANNL